MKIVGFSDLHGDLITNVPTCDVVCICGDIIPLHIQRNIISSAAWIGREFIPWAESLDCKKVILVAGNHDFLFEHFNKKNSDIYTSEMISTTVETELLFPEKITYLQDTFYTFEDKTFYGTPWCPDLSGWAFYKRNDTLTKVFSKIPEKLDVLLSHSPGRDANDTGVSLGLLRKPEYGSKELTDEVLKRNIGLWLCGHVHTGSHEIGKLNNGTSVTNVSIKDESYEIAYEPMVIEI